MAEEDKKEESVDTTVATDADFESFMDVVEGKPEGEEPTNEDEGEKKGEGVGEQDNEADQEDEDDTKEEEEEEAGASEEEEAESEETESDDDDENEYDYDDDESEIEADDDADDDEEDDKDAVIADLKARLEKLEEGKEPEQKPEVIQPAPLPEDIGERIFGDIDFEDAMEDKDKFVQVIKNALTVGRDITHEQVLRSLPDIVLRQTQGYNQIIKMTNQFYRQNKDLRPFKKAVATACNEIHSENPNMPVEEILTKAAKVVRKSVGFQKKAQTQSKQEKKKKKGNRKQKPAFTKKPNARKAEKQKDELADEISSMLNIQ